MSQFSIRTRSRSQYTYIGNLSYVQYRNWSPIFSDTLPVSNFPGGASQVIEDEVWPKPDKLINLDYKNVTNSKTELDIEYRPLNFYINQPSQNIVYDCRGDSTHWWAYHGQPASFIPQLAPHEQNFSNQELWEAIIRIEPKVTDIAPGLNLWSIIFEINKLKDLLGIVVLKAKSLREEAAKKHLELNFGVLPLVSDIQNIYSIFTKLEGTIDSWNKLADSHQLIDYHETIKSDEAPGKGQLTRGCVAYAPGIQSIDYQYEQTSVSKLHVYGYPIRIADNQRYKAYLKALGLDKPITGLWEAVPFSWVVDYFTNTGDVISHWEKGLDSLFKMNLTSAGYSTKITFSCSVEVLDNYTYPYTGTPGLMRGSEKGTIFKRRRLPTKSLFEKAKLNLSNEMKVSLNLGWKQASYLGAVAYLNIKGK